MKRVFLDANVVIDALLEVGSHMDDALRILSLSERGEIDLFCSSLSFATASYFMEKNRMAHDLIIEKLEIFCEYCTPTRVDSDVVRESLDSSFTDFEDALQYFSALTEDVEIIVTRNGRDFVNTAIPVKTPAQFLAMMAEELKDRN